MKIGRHKYLSHESNFLVVSLWIEPMMQETRDKDLTSKVAQGWIMRKKLPVIFYLRGSLISKGPVNFEGPLFTSELFERCIHSSCLFGADIVEDKSIIETIR